jgi:AcrR family transcriptional regulator
MDTKAEVVKRPYHHGDLRAALVSTGMALLEQAPKDELGLRQVARAVGVSATAVYRHFPDKDSLMRAIAAEGFMMMGRMQSEAVETVQSPDAQVNFGAIGAAYVRFALQHPAVFRLMFASAPPRDFFSGALSEVSGPLLALRQHVALLAPAEASDADRKIISVRAWALVHGLAVLALDGMIQIDDAMIDAVVRSAVKKI